MAHQLFAVNRNTWDNEGTTKDGPRSAVNTHEGLAPSIGTSKEGRMLNHTPSPRKAVIA